MGGAGRLDGRTGGGHAGGKGGQLLGGLVELVAGPGQLGPRRLEAAGQLAQHRLDLGDGPLEVVEAVGPAQVGAEVGVVAVAAEVLGEEGRPGDEPGVRRPRSFEQAEGLGLLDGTAVERGGRLGGES